MRKSINKILFKIGKLLVDKNSVISASYGTG